MSYAMQRNMKTCSMVAINITRDGTAWKCKCDGCGSNIYNEELRRVIRWANEHVKKCEVPFNGWEYMPNVSYEWWIIGCL